MTPRCSVLFSRSDARPRAEVEAASGGCLTCSWPLTELSSGGGCETLGFASAQAGKAVSPKSVGEVGVKSTWMQSLALSEMCSMVPLHDGEEAWGPANILVESVAMILLG